MVEPGKDTMVETDRPNATIKVKVQPRASSTQIVGYREDVLYLRVTAPPAEGQANAAVVSLLAQALGVAKSRVRVVRGHTSREKVVVVQSLTNREVEQRLMGLAGRSSPKYN